MDVTKKLYEACLSAKGAYDALKIFGADKHLPGYYGCVKQIDEAIEAYEKPGEE